MRIVTWNVNSIRLRMALVERLVGALEPDVICFQETKVADPSFPHQPLADMGYGRCVIAGMKNHHGVAIASRPPLADTRRRDWCDKGDARHAYATLPGDIELHSLYVPSGGDVPDPEQNPKFAHKLAFLDAQAAWWAERRDDGRPRILVGDLNVAPLPTDVWSHRQLLKVVSHTPVEVAGLETLRRAGGWVDAVRHFITPEQRLYTWWSYRARDWRKSNRGRRLDHIWVTPALVGRLRAVRVFDHARDWDKPSDHVPVVVDLAD